jgi:hypothetical protein
VAYFVGIWLDPSWGFGSLVNGSVIASGVGFQGLRPFVPQGESKTLG